MNCPFFFKIGACRHGDRCTRKHNRPTFSQTILIKQMYHNPKVATMGSSPSMTPEMIQKQFDEFYEEVYDELSSSYGKIEELHVCDNICDHMLGNVYVKFEDEEDAEKALKGLSGRYYAGRPLAVEYSPVTDFREARCRQHEEGQCTRGGYCNFMHLMTPSQPVFYRCFPNGRWGYTREERERDMGPRGDGRRNPPPPRVTDIGEDRDSRSRSRRRHRSYDRHRHSHRSYSRSRDRSRDRSHRHRRSPSRSRERSHRRSDSREHSRRSHHSRHRERSSSPSTQDKASEKGQSA